MKKSLFILVAFIILNIFNRAVAQDTKIILVRHAEKETDGTKDPNLNEEGRNRAVRLAAILKNMEVDVLYSTPYKRTQQTLIPFANQMDLTVIDYDPSNLELFAKEVKENNKGKTVVISGHSNTTPTLANLLLETQVFEQFNEEDYGNLIIVVIPECGKPILIPLIY
ncbi:MAG: histidine phosphatase family protein [Cyclobacteriaceae bacterium]|nr:histidine phosphatase family protein [Cyclobacteriaceae bacterium]